MESLGPLAGLFVSAFVSATILPGNSELVLGVIVAATPDLRWPAVAVATVGNTLGGMTSWAIGRALPATGGERLAPRAVAFARRHGVWTLLLSWVPLAGDALCVASGWLRHDWRLAALCLLLGVADAAARLPPETLESLLELLEGVPDERRKR